MESKSKEQSQRSGRDVGDSQCPLHKSEVVLFCKDCDELVCLDCTTSTHYKHGFEKIADVVITKKTKLKEYITKTEITDIPKLQQNLKSADDRIKKNSDDMGNVVKQIECHREQAKADIDSDMNELIKECKTIQQTNFELLSQHYGHFECDYKRTFDCVTKCKHVLENGDNIAIIDTEKSIPREKNKELPTPKIKMVSFISSKIPIIGKLAIQETEKGEEAITKGSTFVFGSTATTPTTRCFTSSAAYSFCLNTSKPLFSLGMSSTKENASTGKTATAFRFFPKITSSAFVFQQTSDKTSITSSGSRKSIFPEKWYSSSNLTPLNKATGDNLHFTPVIKLPDTVDVVTGEEDDDVLFEQRAKLYRLRDKQWKERGVGNIKILCHRESGKYRFLMRREQVLKICCHHYVTDNMTIQIMPNSKGCAMVWYAMDFSDNDKEPVGEKFAIRFKTSDIAQKFKEMFEVAQKNSPKQRMSTGPEKGEDMTNVVLSISSISSETIQAKSENNDIDVIFVKEEKATPKQVELARRYFLPDNFYLFEKKTPCPGCRGCEEGDAT